MFLKESQEDETFWLEAGGRKLKGNKQGCRAMRIEMDYTKKKKGRYLHTVYFRLTGFCPNSSHWSRSYRKQCLERSVLAPCSYFLFLRFQHSILVHQSLWASVNMHSLLWQANRHVKQFHKWDLAPYSHLLWKSRQFFFLCMPIVIWKTYFIFMGFQNIANKF